ncbi:MAG: PEGA domain-containing protein [Planctomycetota bacterium]
MVRSPENTSSSGSLAVRRVRQSGDFDVGTAHNALELLGENNLYGFLVVSDGLRDVCFFFTRGGLRVVASGFELPTICSRLVQQEVLTPDEARKCARLLQEERNKGKDERGILLEQLRIKANLIDAATREILVECFLDCLFWNEPRYEVATGSLESELAGRRDLSALTLSLGITGMVDELRTKLRTVSEVRRTISSLHVSVEPTQEGRAALENRQLGQGETGKRRMRFMQIVNEESGIRAPDLAERLKIGELELARTLHELSTEGLLKIHRVRESKKEELERIRRMEEAIDHALSQLLRRYRLAADSAGQGDQGRAARHMARAGGILMQQGRDDEAVRTFASALKHSEEDLEAREGYVSSLYGSGRNDEAARESDTLGERYLELGMPSRAKNVLERSLLTEDRATGLQLLVKTHLKLRQPKAAVQAGERLVNRLRREGRREDAQNAAATLLAYADPSERRRILRAAGLDSRLALVFLVTLIPLILLAVPLQQALVIRQAYAQEVEQAHASLSRVEPATLEADLERWQQTFQGLTETYAEHEEIAAHAEQAAARLGTYAHDLALFRSELGEYFPDWEEKAVSLKALREDIERTAKEAQTPELKQQLAQTLEAVKAMRIEGDEQQDELAALRPGPEAVEAAHALRSRFEGDARLLRRSQIRFRVLTEPSGARVTWKGVTYSSRTPSELRLPLEGAYPLKLELEGYLSVSRSLSLDTLPPTGELRVQLELDPNAATEEPQPEQPDIVIRVREPDPVPEPPPAETPRTDTEPRRDPPADTPPTSEPGQRHFEDEVWELQETFTNQDLPGQVEIRSSLPFLDELELSPSYRCQIVVINEVRGKRVFLRKLEVRLRTRSSKDWKLQPAETVELSECERKLLSQRGREVLQGLDNVHGISSQGLLDELQDALDDGIREYKRKTFR